MTTAFERTTAGLVLGVSLLLGGCATGPRDNPQDPMEPLNRQVTRFNEAVDGAVFKPAATVYRDLVPSPVRQGVTNFFHNLSDMWTFVNTVLQLRPQPAGETALRVGINTVFGFGGVLDIASEVGLERHREDLGTTLGRWGVGTGPYVVLPLLGPSTLRDTVAFTMDARGDAVRRLNEVPTRNSLYALRIVNTRQRLLGSERMLEEAALDKYSFTRDAFLQYRRNQIYDGSLRQDWLGNPRPAD